MRMLLKDGKKKVLTLSYDDGVVQDIRLIETMNRYGIKGTFNVNSNLYLPENITRDKFYGRMKLAEAKELYIASGQEVAVHSCTHPFLEELDSVEIISEIVQDRKNLESQFGKIVRGMAYPYGTYNDKVVDVLEKCNIVYARTVESTHSFDFPKNWLLLHPTCHHDDEKLEELIEKFVESTNRWNKVEMFYLWGHSYEFDNNNNWERIERFCEYAGGHEHIWYATNIEVYNYVKAYERLEKSVDGSILYNPSSIDVWVEINNKIECVKGGEVLML